MFVTRKKNATRRKVIDDSTADASTKEQKSKTLNNFGVNSSKASSKGPSLLSFGDDEDEDLLPVVSQKKKSVPKHEIMSVSKFKAPSKSTASMYLNSAGEYTKEKLVELAVSQL